MWSIRVLSGPQAGQTFQLKPGRNLIGRSASCDIQILSAGVSKEHAEIHVHAEKVIVTDLQSSNGTFLNGVRIQTHVLRMGDKLGIHDRVLDLSMTRDQAVPTRVPQQGVQQHPTIPHQGMPSQMGRPHVQVHPHQGVESGPSAFQGSFQAPLPPWQAFVQKVQDYMDRVAMPMIYQLAKVFEYRLVLLGFVGIFIFVTTLLSMIPMLTMTRDAIELESKRRAQSLARSLADLNQVAFLRQEFASLAVDSTAIQEGVEEAIIVDRTSGHIVAPASRAGVTPDIPFLPQIRNEGRGFVGKSGSKIISSFPIGAFDSTTGEQTVRAYAVIVYDMAALEVDDGRAIGLFLQTLVIAGFVGFIIFYFMYSLIEFPIRKLNSDLDLAMREKRDSTQSEFQYPALQALIGNINSLLSRATDSLEGSSGGGGFGNRELEMENLVQIIGLPGVVLNSEERMIAINPGFYQIARMEPGSLLNQGIQAIPDTALQQNLKELKRRSAENSQMIHTDQLEFGGHPCVMSCQALGQSGQAAEYFIITIAPQETA